MQALSTLLPTPPAHGQQLALTTRYLIYRTPALQLSWQERPDVPTSRTLRTATRPVAWRPPMQQLPLPVPITAFTHQRDELLIVVETGAVYQMHLCAATATDPEYHTRLLLPAPVRDVMIAHYQYFLTYSGRVLERPAWEGDIHYLPLPETIVHMVSFVDLCTMRAPSGLVYLWRPSGQHGMVADYWDCPADLRATRIAVRAGAREPKDERLLIQQPGTSHWAMIGLADGWTARATDADRAPIYLSDGQVYANVSHWCHSVTGAVAAPLPPFYRDVVEVVADGHPSTYAVLLRRRNGHIYFLTQHWAYGERQYELRRPPLRLAGGSD